MKTLFTLLLLIASAQAQLLVMGKPTAASATISLAHDTLSSAGITCSAACPAQTIPATGAGNMLVVLGFVSNPSSTKISAGSSIGGSWVFPANCSAFQSSTTGTVSCAYNLAPNTSTTSVTMTMSATASADATLEFREYSTTAGTWTAETVPAPVITGTCSTTCTAPTVTVTGTVDVIIAGIAPGNTACSVASPFSNFQAPGGNGSADHLNTTSGAGGVFTQGSSCPTGSSGQEALLSIGFKVQ